MYIKIVKSYLLVILIIFTTVLTNRLLIVYEIGISASRSRGGGSVEFTDLTENQLKGIEHYELS